MEKWVSQFGQTMIMVESGVNFTCKNYSAGAGSPVNGAAADDNFY